MRRRAIVVFVVAVLGCAGSREVVHREATTPDGLHPVELHGVYGAFARRDARLLSYQRVRFEAGALGYREPPRYPRGRRVPDFGPARTIELSSEDEARLWRHFRDVFTREFGARSRFALTDEPGPGTLTVRAHILDLVVRQASSSRGAESRFTSRSAVFTVVLDVRDSVTDEPLARIVDRRGTVARNGVARQMGGAIDSIGVRRSMLRWARALRTHLHRLEARRLPEA